MFRVRHRHFGTSPNTLRPFLSRSRNGVRGNKNARNLRQNFTSPNGTYRELAVITTCAAVSREPRRGETNWREGASGNFLTTKPRTSGAKRQLVSTTKVTASSMMRTHQADHGRSDRLDFWTQRRPHLRCSIRSTAHDEHNS